MRNRGATFLLILTLLLPLPASAEGFDDMFGLMFRMMLTAMNVMSDMVDDNDWGGGSWPVSDWSSPWSSMSPGMGMWSGLGMWPGMGMGSWPGSGLGMNPWSSMPWGAGSNAWGGMPWGSGGNTPWGSGWQGAPGNVPYPVNTAPAGGLLDGKWYGSTGDILEIRGDRFRLKSGQYSVKGVLTIQQNLVWMFTQKTNSQMVYSFMRSQTELLLQDSSGNILVFQQHPIAGFKNMSYIF